MPVASDHELGSELRGHGVEASRRTQAGEVAMGRRHPAGRSLAARVPGKAEISAQAALNRGNLHDVRGCRHPTGCARFENMSQPAYKLRSTDATVIYDPARLDEVLHGAHPPETDDAEVDPYRYGWRERCETLEDGSTKLRVIPLTYDDTLNPQLGDRVSHDSIHSKLTAIISGILEMRYEEEPTVAVWSDLKVRTPTRRKAPGKPRKKDAPAGAQGPSPDVCVMGDVRDRDARRESFELEKEPGEIWLAVEVVSKTSETKDYKGILKPYTQLKVREYVAIDPRGKYLDGPVKLRAWRRNPGTKRLRRVALDKEGRFHSETTGLLFGTGPYGRGLEIRDAATGELLRPPLEEASWQAERAEQEAAARRQADEARCQAEERAEQEAEVRRQAEERGIEDLCAVLGLAWSAERSAQVESMSSSELEALRRHLVNEKTWPEPFSDAQP